MKNILLLGFLIAVISACSELEPAPVETTAPTFPEGEKFRGFEVPQPDSLLYFDIIVDQSDTSKTFISGLRNDKIWIGEFANSTKKLLKEYTDPNSISLNQTTHLGYDEYKNYTVKSIGVRNLMDNNGSFIYLASLFPNEAVGDWNCFISYVNKSGDTKRINRNNSRMNIYKWYNEYIMIEDYTITPSSFYCYSSSLDSIYEAKEKKGDYYIREILNAIPVSIEEGMWIKRWAELGNNGYEYDAYLLKINFRTDEVVWALPLNEDISGDPKLNLKVLSINDKVYTLEWTVIHKSGKKIVRKFDVDVETGIISNQTIS